MIIFYVNCRFPARYKGSRLQYGCLFSMGIFDYQCQLLQNLVNYKWIYPFISSLTSNILTFSYLKRNQVKNNIIKVFAGPADTGIFSPSVQNTIHITQKLVLDTIPEVCLPIKKKIYCLLLVAHYFCYFLSHSDSINGNGIAQHTLRQH